MRENPASKMNETSPTPQQKALRINLDSAAYGTFAEIGAGHGLFGWRAA